MIVALSPELAARAGCAEVDVREDANGYPEAFDGERRLGCFTLMELARLQTLARPPVVVPERGRPLRRGEKRAADKGPASAARDIVWTRNMAGTRSGRRARRMA